MKKALFFIALFLSVPALAETGAIADSLWNRANVLYADTHYQEALDNYMEIERSGKESATLYYNMGNTYFQMRYIAYAILYYEKALRLEPNNPDIAYNLEIAREQCIDRIEPVPVFFCCRLDKKKPSALIFRYVGCDLGSFAVLCPDVLSFLPFCQSGQV